MVLVLLGNDLGSEEAAEVHLHGLHHSADLEGAAAASQVPEVVVMEAAEEVAAVPIAADHLPPGLMLHGGLPAPAGRAASRPSAVLAAAALHLSSELAVAAAIFGPRLCGCHVIFLNFQKGKSLKPQIFYVNKRPDDTRHFIYLPGTDGWDSKGWIHSSAMSRAWGL